MIYYEADKLEIKVIILNIKIDNLGINYEVTGEGKPVILLHGWLCSLDTMKPIENILSKKFKVYNVDLPGFGKSDMPENPFSTEDFANFLDEFIKKLDIKNPILIGHSNGGRTAINYAGRNLGEINKIILIDSAGIKPKRGLSYYIKVYTFKTLKHILNIFPKTEMFNNIRERLLGKFGSSDYKNSSEVLRKTMSIIINEDQTEILKNINVPTLIIWGENDDATPLSDAKIMEKNIKDSGLVVLKDAGHFSYLDKYQEFTSIITSFLKEDMND